MPNESTKIVILISADLEWENIKKTLNPNLSLQSSPFGEWFSYDVDVQDKQIPVVFFQTGCGKIPAAAATQYALNIWQPSVIVNLGTCGGSKGKVKKDDILLVTKTVVYDICERAGHNDEQIAKYTSDLDLSWLKKPYPLKAQPATMATADQDLDPKSIEDLHERYGAVAADWESGAIAYVASRKNNIKCLILRGVSDVVDPLNGKSSNERAIREGTKKVMKRLIDKLPDWIAKVSPFEEQ